MPYTEELKQKIEAYIEENRQAALEFLEALVNLEGKDGEEAQLRQTAAFLQEQFANAGLETSLLEAGGGHAPVVTGVLNSDVPGRELIFTGHYDTVFPAGSWGPSPFRAESGKAYGPGVCDMKGGPGILRQCGHHSGRHRNQQRPGPLRSPSRCTHDQPESTGGMRRKDEGSL